MTTLRVCEKYFFTKNFLKEAQGSKKASKITNKMVYNKILMSNGPAGPSQARCSTSIVYQNFHGL